MYAESHAGLDLQCPLFLPDLNQNLNVTTNVSETCQYNISRISLRRYSSCFMRKTDRHRHGESIDELLQMIVSNVPEGSPDML